jgi:hypothetical protein
LLFDPSDSLFFPVRFPCRIKDVGKMERTLTLSVMPVGTPVWLMTTNWQIHATFIKKITIAVESEWGAPMITYDTYNDDFWGQHAQIGQTIFLSEDDAREEVDRRKKLAMPR